MYKVLLEDSQAHSLHIVCGCFHTTEAELSIDRETWPAKPKTFTVWLFIETFVLSSDSHFCKNANTFGRVSEWGDYLVLLSVTPQRGGEFLSNI